MIAMIPTGQPNWKINFIKINNPNIEFDPTHNVPSNFGYSKGSVKAAEAATAIK